MGCWDNFMQCCCGCVYVVFMMTISCCGLRRVSFGGLKVKRKRKNLRSTRQLIDRILELTKPMDKEITIKVVGEAKSGKSSYIRSLQAVFRGSLERDQQDTESNNEQFLCYEGRKLPIFFNEYTPKHDNGDNTELLDMNANAVIFVVNSRSVSEDSFDEMLNRYYTFSNFLIHTCVPFNVVVRKNDIEDASEVDEDCLSRCCSIYATSLENIFPVKCYTTETNLIQEKNVKLLQPLRAVLEDVAVSIAA